MNSTKFVNERLKATFNMIYLRCEMGNITKSTALDWGNTLISFQEYLSPKEKAKSIAVDDAYCEFLKKMEGIE